jgi:hypothetical protein
MKLTVGYAFFFFSFLNNEKLYRERGRASPFVGNNIERQDPQKKRRIHLITLQKEVHRKGIDQSQNM